MTAPSTSAPPTVTEVPREGPLPVWVHPGWRDRWPWLLQGTTARGEEDAPFDLSWFTEGPTGAVQRRWDALLGEVGAPAAVLAPQPHASAVRFHDPLPPGLHRSAPCDGHVVAAPGMLAAVTVADCVPVWLVHPGRRVVAVLHAGWRGVAAGVLERGVGVLVERVGVRPADLHAHFGPSICGRCYEVGAEVHEALDRPRPRAPAPIDLRAVLVERARALGLDRGALSVSGHCTLHGEPFFSHRGGDSGRQVAFAGLR